MILAGLDLAWQSESNPSAIASGELDGTTLTVLEIDSVIHGINEISKKFSGIGGLKGAAIDAPLIIRNATGQRACETAIAKAYGSKGASCHSSNTELYPDAKSVYLSDLLLHQGFSHLSGEKW